MPKHLLQKQLELDGMEDRDPLGDDLWVLDLHTMSVAASRMSLLRVRPTVCLCLTAAPTAAADPC